MTLERDERVQPARWNVEFFCVGNVARDVGTITSIRDARRGSLAAQRLPSPPPPNSSQAYPLNEF